MKPTILMAVFLAVTQCIHARTEGDSTSIAIPTVNEMLSEIIRVAGVQASFQLKESDVPNIEAMLLHRKRYIYYNPVFISNINRITRGKWGTMMLLAHEVGHHLTGHTRKKTGSTPELELEADEFAGYILNKLGATLEQAQQVMKHIARIHASATHPGRASRLEAIRKGWERGDLALNR